MKNLGIFICSLLISAFSVSALFAADTLPPGDSAKARSRSAARRLRKSTLPLCRRFF